MPRSALGLLLSIGLALIPVPELRVAHHDRQDRDDTDERSAPELLHAESDGSVRIAGQAIDYTAMAGTLETKNDEGQAIAHFRLYRLREEGLGPARGPAR